MTGDPGGLVLVCARCARAPLVFFAGDNVKSISGECIICLHNVTSHLRNDESSLMACRYLQSRKGVLQLSQVSLSIIFFSHGRTQVGDITMFNIHG